MKKLIALLLMAMLLLTGCQNNGGESVAADATEPTAVYDWMAGESPVPSQRTGLYTQGITSVCNSFECTQNGVYFLCSTDQGTFLLYGDHGSDTIIKLCGRADCDHNSEECNSFFVLGTSLCFYDGFLYTTEDSGYDLSLVRMDLDGTDRITMLSLKDLYAKYGFTGTYSPTIWNGIFTFGAYKLDENGDELGATFHYKLDGTMKHPEIAALNGIFLYNAGNQFLIFTEAQYGGEKGGIAAWNPDRDTATYLMDHPGQPGYFGDTAAFYFKNGAVRCLTYETRQEDILFETGLEGDYYAACYPDCIVISCRNDSDRNLYIYNWAFELVGKVKLNFPSTLSPDNTICGETAERLILTDNNMFIPRYYIEKSDFGTGNIEIHEYKLPDLTAELKYMDELREDQEWLNNG